MSTPGHIDRIIERLDPVGREALEQQQAEMEAGVSKEGESSNELIIRALSFIATAKEEDGGEYNALMDGAKRISSLSQECEKLRQERDELAAHATELALHAGRCATELADLIDRHNTQGPDDGSMRYDHQTPWETLQVTRRRPVASLAEVKARAIEDAMSRINVSSNGRICYYELMDHADHLRKEAQ
ncbi:hypothetical protein PU634_04895 [Oceanimonas pelagia]|uniref:Uncharacterized protein n=1 Tax=Oceanimonas pelagia TaxID=3028314 RepID=A0AA50KQE6_9GAMM|nr:hypothetical protein [Oceanimonas pelagia]WMC11704.1 hypothetical protein PU634_04895 [Oceanimonas pelagia]